jgi:hypothetical protein
MSEFVEGTAIIGRMTSAEPPNFARQGEVANGFLYSWAFTWDSNRYQ